MPPDDRVQRWHEAWECRRQGFLEEVVRLREFLTGEAMEILDEAQRIAAAQDPATHAGADIERLVERVNGLTGPAPVMLEMDNESVCTNACTGPAVDDAAPVTKPIGLGKS